MKTHSELWRTMKRCPKCGEKPRLKLFKEGVPEMGLKGTWGLIQCPRVGEGCGFAGPLVRTPEEAVAGWNRLVRAMRRKGRG